MYTDGGTKSNMNDACEEMPTKLQRIILELRKTQGLTDELNGSIKNIHANLFGRNPNKELVAEEKSINPQGALEIIYHMLKRINSMTVNSIDFTYQIRNETDTDIDKPIRG